MDRGEKQRALDELKAKMKEDESLPLKSGATNLVFGEGDADSKVVFVGEGPGYHEDIKGRPFVGMAGALLNQLLVVIGIPRESVYITNVVHYRPPQNRDPLPEEIAAFQPYLDKIVEIIDPVAIVTLGRFSMGKYLPGASISKVHGRPQRITWKGKRITIVPMYHPAAALRNGAIKLLLTEDFKKLPEMIKEAQNTKDDGNTTSGSAKMESKQMQLI